MKEFFIFCAMSSLAGHFLAIKQPVIQNVTFLSTNFENILTWKIEEGSPSGTVYQVRYKRSRTDWQSKAECQNITQLFCNLTRETEYITEYYYAEVRAIVANCCVSNWTQSLIFCPWQHTTIGKPSVDYISGLRSIKFSIQPPYMPLSDKENRIMTVVDVFNELNFKFQYEITLFSQKTQEKWAKIENDNEFEITGLDPGTEYNGIVRLKYSSKNGTPQAFQVWTLSGPFLAIKPPVIQNVTYLSTNFEKILTWKIEEESPPGTVYQVQYKIFETAYWHSKAECQNITQLFCNLTREMKDVTEQSHARVRAIVPNCCVSNWVQSLIFCPKFHSLAIKPPIIHKYPQFLSTNFENIFTWKIEEGFPPGTVYQVRYKIYGDAYWHSKAECQNITQLFCNLTRETEDATEWYYAKVRAIVPNCCVSNWVRSLHFSPKYQTTIGKPSVNYTPGLYFIKFSIQPPDTPLRDKENRILTVVDVLNKHNYDVQYEITLFSQKTHQKWKKTGNDKEFEITDLDPGMEYNGTVHLKYSGFKGSPQAFQVQTLADTRWLPYVLGTILFILICLSGTIYYLIYKYIKPHTDQKPASLDFKDVSRFRPLLLNVELSPSSLSKTTPLIPEVRPAELCQPVLNMLKHQESFSPTELAYQQQAKTLPIQPPLQHFRQADAPSTDYTPQVIKNSPLEHNPSTLTNGLSMEGASSINKANHVIELDSFISSGPYKAQRPEWANEELQESETHQKPEEEVKSVS